MEAWNCSCLTPYNNIVHRYNNMPESKKEWKNNVAHVAHIAFFLNCVLSVSYYLHIFQTLSRIGYEPPSQPISRTLPLVKKAKMQRLQRVKYNMKMIYAKQI